MRRQTLFAVIWEVIGIGTVGCEKEQTVQGPGKTWPVGAPAAIIHSDQGTQTPNEKPREGGRDGLKKCWPSCTTAAGRPLRNARTYHTDCHVPDFESSAGAFNMIWDGDEGSMGRRSLCSVVGVARWQGFLNAKGGLVWDW